MDFEGTGQAVELQYLSDIGSVSQKIFIHIKYEHFTDLERQSYNNI